MRWPKPDELRRWTPDDQLVFRKWRRVVVIFYCAVVGLLAVGSMLAVHRPDSKFRDLMTVERQTVPLPTVVQYGAYLTVSPARH